MEKCEHEYRFAYQGIFNERSWDVYYCIHCLNEENLEATYYNTITITGGVDTCEQS